LTDSDEDSSSSAIAASSRRLWVASKQLANKGAESLSAEANDEIPKQISQVVIRDLFRKTEQRGGQRGSDRTTPSDYAIAKCYENFRMGGALGGTLQSQR